MSNADPGNTASTVDRDREEGFREAAAMGLFGHVIHNVAKAGVMPAAHPCHPDGANDLLRQGKVAVGQKTITSKEGVAQIFRPAPPLAFSDVDAAIRRAFAQDKAIHVAISASGLEGEEAAIAAAIVAARQQGGISSPADIAQDVEIAVYTIRRTPEIGEELKAEELAAAKAAKLTGK